MTVDAIGPSLDVWFRLLLPWAGPVVVLAWLLGCRRVRWQVADFVIVIAPYAVWFGVDEIWHRPKSMANLGEAILLALIVDAIIVARLIVGRKCYQAVASLGALGLAGLAAVIVLWLSLRACRNEGGGEHGVARYARKLAPVNAAVRLRTTS